ncbi:MAG: putative lipid II flippase FtsW [Candidatus Curtissbacteria bacterium]|nr:putative lipid II flippase FtsW [Candidatus Curtissbacteria bacterium]
MVGSPARLSGRRLQIDIPLIAVVIFLLFFGLAMIYDASVVAAYRDFNDQLYYFKNQLVWASLGTIALAFFSFFDYHKITKYAPFIFGLALVALIVVLIPGIGSKVYGARRWITVAGFTFQPSEFAKLALIAYQASILAKFQAYKMRLLDVAYVMFLPAFIMIALVILEPDLGTALIFIAISTAMYFIANGPIWHFLMLIPPFALAAVIAVITQPYRIERLKTFLDPTYDPQGSSYQINQILISLANGGVFGVGIGGSRGKFDFIPEVHSDAIFAVVAEELGFVGAMVIIALMLFLILRGISVIKAARDMEGRILAGGICSLLAAQTFLNLGSIVALVPLTGIPLPFISYGGSSLLITMISIGILVNIRRQSR